MSPEVVRLLSYMLAFCECDNRCEVAELMDKIANAPNIGSIVTTKRRLPTEPDDSNAIYRVAGMALEAVEYVEGSRDKPDWFREAGIV